LSSTEDPFGSLDGTPRLWIDKMTMTTTIAVLSLKTEACERDDLNCVADVVPRQLEE